MNIGISIVVGAALIAASIAISERYTTTQMAPDLIVRLDGWTGKMVSCENVPGNDAPLQDKYFFMCSHFTND